MDPYLIGLWNKISKKKKKLNKEASEDFGSEKHERLQEEINNLENLVTVHIVFLYLVPGLLGAATAAFLSSLSETVMKHEVKVFTTLICFFVYLTISQVIEAVLNRRIKKRSRSFSE